MNRMSKDMCVQDRSIFQGCVRAVTLIGCILAAVIVTMAAAGSHVVTPAQAVARSTGGHEWRAPQPHAPRSGAMTGYKIVL